MEVGGDLESLLEAIKSSEVRRRIPRASSGRRFRGYRSVPVRCSPLPRVWFGSGRHVFAAVLWLGTPAREIWGLVGLLNQ
jgi:hypothetical protein